MILRKGHFLPRLKSRASVPVPRVGGVLCDTQICARWSLPFSSVTDTPASRGSGRPACRCGALHLFGFLYVRGPLSRRGYLHFSGLLVLHGYLVPFGALGYIGFLLVSGALQILGFLSPILARFKVVGVLFVLTRSYLPGVFLCLARVCAARIMAVNDAETGARISH